MKKILALCLAIATLCSVALTFSSCGTPDDDGPEFNTYYCGELYDFDPAKAYFSEASMNVLNLLYQPLFVLKDNGKVENGLADGYRIVEDEEKNLYQMVITLGDSYWSADGELVTGDDVVFAWKRIIACDFQSPAAPLLYDIKNAVAVKQGDVSIDDFGVVADMQEVTITFEGKIDYDAFLRNLTSIALVPLRESAVSLRPDYWAKHIAYITTNGPFTVRTLNFDTGEFTLARNKYYQRERESTEYVGKYVKPNMITTNWIDAKTYNPGGITGWTPEFRLERIKDNYDEYIADVFAKFTEKQIEAIEETVFFIGDIPVDKRAEFASDAVVSDASSTYSYLFNTENPLFADARVRQALSLAIDRNALAELLVFGEAATGLITPSTWEGDTTDSFRKNDLLATSANLTEAKALLKDAGVTGGSFTITYHYSSRDEAVANYIKDVWEDLGFDVEIEEVTFQYIEGTYDDIKVEEQKLREPELYTKYLNRDFDVIAMDYQMFSKDAFVPLAAFTSDMNGNGIKFIPLDEKDPDSVTTFEVYKHNTGFTSDAYDTLMDKALAEKDVTKKSTYLHQAEELLLEEMPVMPLIFNQTYYVKSDELSGVSTNTYGYHDFTEATIKDYPKYFAKEDVVEEEEA